MHGLGPPAAAEAVQLAHLLTTGGLTANGVERLGQLVNAMAEALAERQVPQPGGWGFPHRPTGGW